MSDEESEGEVPVCGSFEPQVWRKGYCRNCFHPGSKHVGGNLIIEDDKRKFGKENIPKSAEKSKTANEKGKPLKPSSQDSSKTDKIKDKIHDKLTDKEKPSFRDKFEKLQKEKSKQEDALSSRKIGSGKDGADKKSVTDKTDSSKNIPPPVAPKVKGLDKLKSKSTSDITEEIKSPVGNKLFKPPAQKDSLDKSKSKFGSAENVSKFDKKTEGTIKLKSGSAENLVGDKLGASQKHDRNKTDLSDKSKPDYRSLLVSKDSKLEEKTKDKPVRESAIKTDKDNKTVNKPKLDIEASKKESSQKFIAQLKSPISSDKSPLFEKDKPDFKSKFEKPELRASKEVNSEKKDTKEISKISVQDKVSKDIKQQAEKQDLKSVQEKEKKESKSKPEQKPSEEKEKKDDKQKYGKLDLKPLQDKDKKDDKIKADKPQLKTVDETEKKDLKAKFDKPSLKTVEEKEKVDFKTKYEKPDLKKVDEPDKKDNKTKYEKPDLKKVEEPEKKDYRSKYEKPELKIVEEKEKVDYRTKYEKPDLKKVEEKEKQDYRTKYEKPELKTVEEKEKKDYRAKFEKPELKGSKKEESKKDDKTDFQRKSSVGDKIAGLNVSQVKSSAKDDSGSDKGKWKPKGSTEEKEISKKEDQKIDLKAGLRSIKKDDKDKPSSISGKSESLKESEKTKSSPANKWLSSLEKDKSKETKADDLKPKSDKFQLKSVKNAEKEKTDIKLTKDLKTTSIKDDKTDSKKALLEKYNPKSSKTDEAEKKDFKAKLEKTETKTTKPGESESKAEKQDPKKSKVDTSIDKKKTDNISNEKSINKEDREILDNELNQKAEIENKNKADKDQPKYVVSETDSLKQEAQVNEKNISSNTSGVISVPPANHSQKSNNLSSVAETGLDEPDNACASIGTRGESPVHVDTQVFTSSRNKTAGVESVESDLFTTTPQKGISGSLSIEKLTEYQKREKSEEKGPLKDDRKQPEIVEKKTSEEDLQEERSKPGIESDVEKLKRELLKMAEKCKQLEDENESLKHGLTAKESDHSELEKQKREVEALILGLKEQVKSMESRCEKLESDNSNLISNLKMQQEVSKSQPANEQTEEIQDSIQYSESMVEELIEENENLKQEIQDLKVEMEEMYDSFRDQEAEEFRELQKELEITAKNCRILQFKMRKAERRNEQLEDERNLYEDKLRILQNQFENKDAVAHIKTLEQELKMAKDVSVRLHDELDLLDDKRTKVEEENRHLTELLEQADRKQFRLEIEVDKLRDQIIDLRQRLSAATADDPDNPPRKINCAEFLALHRDII